MSEAPQPKPSPPPSPPPPPPTTTTSLSTAALETTSQSQAKPEQRSETDPKAEAEPQDNPGPGPDLAIRARPPSPRRLSRKVLLAAAGALGAVIVFALVHGLSEPDGGGEVAAPASAGNPPETIARAPSDYDAGDLSTLDASAIDEAEPTAELAAHEEAFFASAAPSAPTQARQPASAREPARDGQGIENARLEAARSPIVFAEAGGVGGLGASRASERGDGEGMQLMTRLVSPRSPYELMAGSVIAAALLTELNSDRPGSVIAQLTAPVYDSVAGRHLLAPQGTRLIGVYDADTRYGDRRLMLRWRRLILPNGRSIDLEAMEAGDASGAAGLAAQVDNHWGRLAAAALISAVIGVGANQAEADGEDEDGFARSVGDAAAAEAARAGGRIIDRELGVRPTLIVRAGAPVRVLVTRDIRLEPYRE